MNISMYAIVIELCVLLLVKSSAGRDEDSRCKCVCPDIANHTEHVYIKTNLHVCTCENVVDNVVSKSKEYCAQCECNYETRNTTTIKIVVLTIICIIALLVTYMLFLLCLDPLLSRRSAAANAPAAGTYYHEQTNEDEITDVTERDGFTSTLPRYGRSDSGGSGGGVISRVNYEQDKWKRQVQEQRRSVYVKRSLLN